MDMNGYHLPAYTSPSETGTLYLRHMVPTEVPSTDEDSALNYLELKSHVLTPRSTTN